MKLLGNLFWQWLVFILFCGIWPSVKSDREAKHHRTFNTQQAVSQQKELGNTEISPCFCDSYCSISCCSSQEKESFGWKLQIAGIKSSVWVTTTLLLRFEKGGEENPAMCLFTPLLKGIFLLFKHREWLQFVVRSQITGQLPFKWLHLIHSLLEFVIYEVLLLISATDYILSTLSALLLILAIWFSLHLIWACVCFAVRVDCISHKLRQAVFKSRKALWCSKCITSALKLCFGRVLFCQSHVLEGAFIMHCRAGIVSTCFYNGAVCWRPWWVKRVNGSIGLFSIKACS